jgi:predicted  nucleic acid-binding Zn-ribbon protein
MHRNNVQKKFQRKKKKIHKNNKTAKTPNENLGPTKNSTINTRQNTVNILTTNAAGLRYKAGELKNKIKHFDSTIFSVQETHFARKGRFEIEKYVIFEAIRKGKQKGGSMLGVHVDLCPVLVQEYSDKFELIVV